MKRKIPRNNREIVELFCNDVFISHDLTRLDEYMRDDYIQHNPDVPQGKSGFIQFFEETFRAMPDFKYTLKKIVAEGDIVIVYSTTSGTHTGGPWLDKNPTGNKPSMSLIYFVSGTATLPNTRMWPIRSGSSASSE